MTSERWARIKEIFGAALELPDQERLAFLKQSCGSDSTLREEVERLLDAERTWVNDNARLIERVGELQIELDAVRRNFHDVSTSSTVDFGSQRRD